MNRKIARFNQRITFQKYTTIVDKYKNHTNTWEDYFSCWAYADTYQRGSEQGTAAVVRQPEIIYFETRYCSELALLTNKEYRVFFNGKSYNIEEVDMMNYQNRVIRIRCSLIQSASGS